MYADVTMRLTLPVQEGNREAKEHNTNTKSSNNYQFCLAGILVGASVGFICYNLRMLGHFSSMAYSRLSTRRS